ncbi:MAG: hypothetical protein GW949_10080 [Spirochaetales bacterium]|nr:hypothetical protein [Spirochaetales bacterium]
MKKLPIIYLFVLLAIGSANLFGFGIGLSGGGTLGSGIPGTNLMLQFKPDESRFLFGLGADFQQDIALGVSADYWFRNDPLVDIIQWYLGAGLYGGLRTGSNPEFVIAGRLPIGLNMYLLDNFLELFLEAAPTVGVGTKIPAIGVQIGLGFRLWFPENTGFPALKRE